MKCYYIDASIHDNSSGYEDADDEEVADFFAGVAQNPDWAPYASKTVSFLLALQIL